MKRLGVLMVTLITIAFISTPVLVKAETEFQIWHSFSSDLDIDEISGVAITVNEAVNWLLKRGVFDKLPHQRISIYKRVAISVSVLIPGYLLIGIPTAYAHHEGGHSLQYQKAGLIWYAFVIPGTSQEPIEGTAINSYLVMLKNIYQGTGFLAGQYDVGWEKFWESDLSQHAEEFTIMLDAGGLNQNQYTLEMMAEKVYRGNANPIDYPFYFSNLIFTATYSNAGTDISRYVENINKRGVSATEEDIRYYSQFLKLLSNSNITLIRSISNYWLTGKVEVKPLSWKAGEVEMFWPEFASYLTLNGPTIKVNQRNNYHDSTFEWSFEKALPTDVYEFGLGWDGPVFGSKKVSGKAKLFYNTEGGYWLEGGPTIHLSEWADIGLKGFYGNSYSFRREIVGNVPNFVEEKESGVKAFLRFTF